MKELEKVFIGRGEVKGFTFTQIKQNEKAFLYEVKDEFGSIHYEIFKRVENIKYGCISYPKSKSFGRWAWTCKTLDRGIEKFNELSA